MYDEIQKSSQQKWNAANIDKVRKYARDLYHKNKDDPERKAIRNARERGYYQAKKERIRLETMHIERNDIPSEEATKLKDMKNRKEGIKLRKKIRELELKLHELEIN